MIRGSAVCLAFALQLALLAQSRTRWYAGLGGNYTHVNHPLGADHGPYAGHGANGVGGEISCGAERAFVSHWCILVEGAAVLRRTGYRFDEGELYDPGLLLADGLDKGYRSTTAIYGQGAGMLTYRGFPGLRLEAGLFASRLVGARDSRKGERWVNGRSGDLHERMDITGTLPPWEVGWVLGAMIEGPQRIHAQVRCIGNAFSLGTEAANGASMESAVSLSVLYALRAEPVR